MEEWDIYDQDRLRTGESIRRGQRLAPGEYHLVVHVCIFHPNGKLLIQHRHPRKRGWPDKWDLSVGGSAQAGENSRATAKRETQEELGLSYDFSKERPFFTIHFSRGFDDFYLIEVEVELADLKLQKSEVQGVRWVNREELMELWKQGDFIPYHRSLLDMIFEIRHQRGAHPPRRSRDRLSGIDR